MHSPHGTSIGHSRRTFALLVLGSAAVISACSDPVAVSLHDPGGPWASVSVGGSFVCGTTTDMRAYCWGWNVVGQLGIGSASGPEGCGTAPCSTRPLAVDGELRFTSITAGAAHACGLTTEGAAYCWGSNARGQLGTLTSERCSSFGTSLTQIPCSTRPVRVSGSSTWVAITAGGAQTCAITEAGAAYCWGSNLFGQLGNGSSSTSGTDFGPTPTPVADGLTFQLLSAGSGHTCGLTTDGRAFCWGLAGEGQLGTEDADRLGEGFAVRPAAVAGEHTFTTISADGHTCAVAADQRAYCWGTNASNQLGAGATTLDPQNCTDAIYPCSPTPVAVATGLGFGAVSAALGYTCGIATDRAAYCWGANDWGQLGTGSTTGTNTPVRVLGGLTFNALSTGGTAIAAGTTGVTCGVTVQGAAFCWGSNRYGELGSGARTAPEENPPGRTVPSLVTPPPAG